MIVTIEPGRYFHVSGSSPHEIASLITEAVGLAHENSKDHGWLGVLISRHNPSLYTVALSHLVLYGQTAERAAPYCTQPPHHFPPLTPS